MMPRNALILSLVTVSFASLTAPPSEFTKHLPSAHTEFFPCTEGTKDSICQFLKQPKTDTLTTITHHNGTVERISNMYTREQLKVIRERSNITSIEGKPLQDANNGPANFITSLMKRESAPPICWNEVTHWYDTQTWGYWYQAWHQVGSCFYCDSCTETIQWSFSVSETWTLGLEVGYQEALVATFGFSWGHTKGLSDTRTCIWNPGQEHGCHSTWYQPLMSYHNGVINYQTHTHCIAGQGQPARDSYHDHHYTFANVNQAGNNGVNQGNLGCNSGCKGRDHRQYVNGNNGGTLWPYAN